MRKHRLLNAIFCFLVIFSLIVNMAPMRANAVAVSSAVIAGIVATVILGTAGVVFHPQTVEEITALGDSMRTYLYQWGTSAEKLDEVEEFFGNLTLMNFDPDDDPDDDTPHQTQVKLARGILSGIVLWVASLGLEGTTIKEKFFDSSKLSSYNIPSWDIDAFPYFFIYSSHDLSGLPKNYTLYVCDAPITYLGDNGKAYLYSPWPIADYPTFKYIKWTCDYPGEGRWKGDGTVRTITNFENTVLWTDQYYGLVYYYQSLKYSNFPIYDTIGNVRFQGDETSVLYVDVPFLPGSLVGDVAPGLADGSTRPEDLLVPDVLDLGGVISSNSSAVDDVIELQDKLVSGDITYDDYFGFLLADTPTFTQNLDTTLVTYNVGDTAIPLSVTAMVTDAGTLTYQWYVWKEDEAVPPLVPDAVASTFMPPTDEEGKYHYRCVVTNTNDKGLTAIATSREAVIEVLDPAISDPMGETTSGTFINKLVDAFKRVFKTDDRSEDDAFADSMEDERDKIHGDLGFLDDFTLPPYDNGDIDIGFDGILDDDDGNGISLISEFFEIIFSIEHIYIVFFIAFTLALISFAIFGKR